MTSVCDKLIVFTRYPRPGEAKTRLIPAVGPQGAAELQRTMTARTLAQADELSRRRRSVQVEVRYCGGSAEEMRRTYGLRRYASQGDGDLGARLSRAAADAFDEGYRSLVIVGTDCPDLTADIIDQAFGFLREKDVALGPALDGGYYLIGLRRPAPALFEDIPWGSASVLAATVEAVRRSELSFALLQPLADVDRPEDLAIGNIRHCCGTTSEWFKP